MKKIIAVILFLCVFFTGCKEEEEDLSISQITITGIPAQIPVFGKENETPVPSNETYRVYLNASDDMDPDKRSAVKAKGWWDMVPTTNNTCTVTIQLKNPNPLDGSLDPTIDTGSWSGTAKYFSVVISPQDVSADRENAIWAKASIKPLDKGMAICDWNSLTDFRAILKNPQNVMYQNIQHNLDVIFDDIICEDPDLTRPTRP